MPPCQNGHIENTHDAMYDAIYFINMWGVGVGASSIQSLSTPPSSKKGKVSQDKKSPCIQQDKSWCWQLDSKNAKKADTNANWWNTNKMKITYIDNLTENSAAKYLVAYLRDNASNRFTMAKKYLLCCKQHMTTLTKSIQLKSSFRRCKWLSTSALFKLSFRC